MAENDGKVVFELEVDDGKLQAGVNKALAGVQQKVKAAGGAVQIGVKADTAAAQKALSGVKGAAETLESSDPSVTVSAQTAGANKLLGETKGKAEALDATDPKVSVEAQTSGANKLIDETQGKAQTLDATDPKVSVEAETAGANKLLGETQGKAETLDGTDPKVSVEAVTEGANKALTDTQGKAETLDSIDPKVSVEAETAGADKLLGETQGKAETLDGTDPKVSVEAETSGANKLLSETQGNAETLDGTDPKVSVEAQTEGANKALSDTTGAAQTLDSTDPKVTVGADNTAANRQISETQGQADKLGSTTATAVLDADGTAANKQIADTQSRADTLGNTTETTTLDADGTAAKQQISDTKGRADALGNTTETVTLDADGSAADQQISGVKGRADALGNTTETTTLDADGTAANQRISDTQGRADALGNTKETTVLDADGSSANSTIHDTQSRAEALGLARPEVIINADASSAEYVISGIISQLNELDGRTVHVNVNGSGGSGGSGSGSGSGGGTSGSGSDGGGSGGGFFSGVKGAFGKGLGLAWNFVGSAFQAGVSYDAGMRKAMTLMPNMDGGVGGKSVNYAMASNYGEGLLDLSMKTGQSIDTLWEATYNALSASQEFGNTDWRNGQAGDAMLQYLETAAKLAVGGFTDVDTASSSMAKTINAYGVGENGENMYTPEQVADILIKTQNKGITTVGELGQSLSHITSPAAQAGVNFEQVGAMMATMTAQGVGTAEATTLGHQLINEMQKLSTSDNEAVAKIWEKKFGKGKSFSDAMKENNLSIEGVLSVLEEGLKGNKDFQNQGWGYVFSNQSAASAAGLLTNGSMFEDALAYIQDDSVNAVEDAYGMMDLSMQQDLAKLSATWQMVLAQIGSAILPIVQSLLQVLQSPAFQELLNKIVKAITEFINSEEFLNFVDAVAELLTNFISVLTGGMTWTEFLMPIGIWLGNVIMDALSMLLPIINGFIEAISGSVFVGFKDLDTYQVVTDENGTKHVVPASTVIEGERYDVKRDENGGEVLVNRSSGAAAKPAAPSDDASPEEKETFWNNLDAYYAYTNGGDKPNSSNANTDTTGEVSGVETYSDGTVGLKTRKKQADKQSADEAEQTAQNGKQLNNGMMRANEATELSAESAEQGAELQKRWFGSSSAGLDSAATNAAVTDLMAQANGNAAAAAQENGAATDEMAGATGMAADAANINAGEAADAANATGTAADRMGATASAANLEAKQAQSAAGSMLGVSDRLRLLYGAAGNANVAMEGVIRRLNALGYTNGGTSGGTGLKTPSTSNRPSNRPVAAHAVGLDNVPYDGYMALLHKGETILNRPEAAAYRHGSGQVAAIDYNALAAAMAGMSVQMDGRVVGRLVERSVSAAQGERYGRSARSL